MTIPDFNDLVETTFDECRELLNKKGSDYSPGYDRVGNFKQASQRLGVSPLQVLGVYLDKHVCAINTFLTNGAVQSEPIEGRINDVINYMLLLRALVSDLKQ